MEARRSRGTSAALRRPALNYDVFERSQRVPRAPNLKPKESLEEHFRGSAGSCPPAPKASRSFLGLPGAPRRQA